MSNSSQPYEPQDARPPYLSPTAAAAAAKSLQSCPTLCDPIEGSPLGSPVPGILHARTLEWVAISFSNGWKWKVKVNLLKSCPTVRDCMDCSLPGRLLRSWDFPGKSTGVYPNWSLPKPMVTECDTIQPSNPLSSPSPPALNLSQNQCLFKWVSSSQQVAKVLEFQLEHESFQWTPRIDLLYDGLVRSSCSPRDSQESCPTP